MCDEYQFSGVYCRFLSTDLFNARFDKRDPWSERLKVAEDFSKKGGSRSQQKSNRLRSYCVHVCVCVFEWERLFTHWNSLGFYIYQEDKRLFILRLNGHFGDDLKSAVRAVTTSALEMKNGRDAQEETKA